VQELVDSFFDGSRAELAAYLSGGAAPEKTSAAPAQAVPLDAALL